MKMRNLSLCFYIINECASKAKVPLLFLFLSMHFASGVFAQTTFAPKDAFWNYAYNNHNGGMSSKRTIKVTRDTLIGGYPTKTLTQYYDNYSSLPPNPPPSKGINDFGALQIRNDSVFYAGSLPDKNVFPVNAEFIFGFSMKVGDSIKILDLLQLKLTAVVNSISTVTINGNVLKKWNLTKYCSSQGTTSIYGNTAIVEGIGPIDDYLFWNSDGCIIGGGKHEFQCYSSKDLSYNSPCSPVAVGIETQYSGDNMSFLINPNPASDHVDLVFPEISRKGELRIYDLSMRIVVRQSLNEVQHETIDISRLSPGQYMVQILTNNKIWNSKLTKLK